jgi:hypothetical protein
MIADQINLFRENIYAYTKDTFSWDSDRRAKMNSLV